MYIEQTAANDNITNDNDDGEAASGDTKI